MTEPFVTDLLSFELPIYAVLDGAIVPDIEKHLERYEIVGRPLFRDSMDRETVIAGPWLLSPGLSYATVERSVAAARNAGQGVFWIGEQEEEALFRHLRKLGTARMPDGRLMYFRHYDSDVLAAIVPLVDAVQASQIFGLSCAIALIGGSGDGGIVEKPNELLEARPGPISFCEWQIEALNKRQRNLWRENVARKLRQAYPKEPAT